MIKVVIFDLDNTLIDFWGMKKKSSEAAVSAMIDAGLWLNKRKALKILFDLYDKYGIEYKNIFQRFLAKTQKKLDYRLLAAAVVSYRKSQAGLSMPYDGVEKTLKGLRERGYRLAILSDAPKFKTWMRLTELGIVDFFDVVLSLGDTKRRKPHSLPFRSVLKRLRISPDEALMVGDNIKRDILGAKKIGIKTAFAKYGSVYKLNKNLKSNADYEIGRIEDLLNIIKGFSSKKS